MLRNIRILETEHNVTYLLNEVLSLNAQEYRQAYKIPRHTLVLNEVLSLNAQEFLSPALPCGLTLSSMKS